MEVIESVAGSSFIVKRVEQNTVTTILNYFGAIGKIEYVGFYWRLPYFINPFLGFAVGFGCLTFLLVVNCTHRAVNAQR